MTSTSGVGQSGLPPQLPDGSGPSAAAPEDVETFESAFEQSPLPQADNSTIDPRFRLEGWTGYDTEANDKPIDVDSYEPETPDIPKPEEKPKNFLEQIGSDIKKGAQSVIDFLGKPEVAIALRVANVVFAGALVVTAGVLYATGVGAPAATVALALAGAAGLAMQLPIVHDTLNAGVTALLSPVLGAENAEKLGPLATQFMISGLMIAIIATGGSAANAKGALDATVGVFKTMQTAFSGMAQLSGAASPFLEAMGVDVDTAALQRTASMFGVLGSFIPNLASLSESLGSSLSDFLKNPNVDLAKSILTSMKDVPETFAGLIDSNFLKALGSILDTGKELLTGTLDFQDLINLTSTASQVFTSLPVASKV